MTCVDMNVGCRILHQLGEDVPGAPLMKCYATSCASLMRFALPTLLFGGGGRRKGTELATLARAVSLVCAMRPPRGEAARTNGIAPRARGGCGYAGGGRRSGVDALRRGRRCDREGLGEELREVHAGDADRELVGVLPGSSRREVGVEPAKKRGA